MRLGQILVRLFIIANLILLVLAVAIYLRFITLPPHYDPFTPPDLLERPYWLTSTKLKVLDRDPEDCSIAFASAGVDAVILPRVERGRACYLENTIVLRKFSKASMNAEQTRCNIAARLYMWERHVVQPSAQKYFGQGVKEISHFGSYSCRTIARSHNMSEHATANAFDISGLRLANGRMISVVSGWKAGGKDAEFLHEVRSGLCDYFNLTLSPDYNADHKDHFHVDMGWVRGCH